jgi:hypothetical protein
MATWIAQKSGPIPPPRQPPTVQLSELIGSAAVDEIEKAGAVRLHALATPAAPTCTTPTRRAWPNR